MPQTRLLAIPQEEQAQMLAVLRRSGYGYFLALHVLLLCAAGHTPTESAAVLFCSRSGVYRIVCAYRAGTLGWTADEDGTLAAPVRTSILMPWLRRSLGTLLKAPPRRLWLVPDALELRDAGRAVGRQAAPHGVRGDRAALAARTRLGLETGQAGGQRYRSPTGRAVGPHSISFRAPGGRDVMGFADELDIHLLPKVGYAWIPKGARELVMTPGRSPCPRAGQPTKPAAPPARPAIGA